MISQREGVTQYSAGQFKKGILAGGAALVFLSDIVRNALRRLNKKMMPDLPQPGSKLDSEDRPDLSIVVVVYNMPREAPRTLFSLSAKYQRDIDTRDFEVIVVDNGSDPPFDAAILGKLEGNFGLLRLDPAPPSPARALNVGLAAARGRVIGAMVDGARIATPGLLHFARCGARMYPQAVVVTPGWYLGSDFQAWAVLAGYDAKQEDALLEFIHWPENGYRLFEISTADESSIGDFPISQNLQSMPESNALFMARENWERLAGFDERFDLPGGGLLNPDTYARALALPDARVVLLAGEATFHQVHGGISTNAPPDTARKRLREWIFQYYSIRGRHWKLPKMKHPLVFLGGLPSPISDAAALPAPFYWPPSPQSASPSFNWPTTESTAGDVEDPVVAALMAIMRNEFREGRFDSVAFIGRLARMRSPQHPELLRVLRVVAPYFDDRAWQYKRQRHSRFHFAVGKAYRIIGEPDRAAAEFRHALKLEPDIPGIRDELDSLGCSSFSSSSIRHRG